jgi:dienelactone hydrolase
MLALLGAVAPILDRVLGAFLPDQGKRQEVILTILSQLQASDQAQMAVNQAEAGHQSVFVAGWRPFIGWCCGAALAYQYVAAPLIVWGAALFGKPLPMPPTIDAVMWELMFGMLGMGALRSFEKIKGVAR